MPLCYLNTNLQRSEFDKNIEERMAKCIAEAGQVPLEHVFVSTQAGLPTFCAGSEDPAMICQIHAKKIFENEAIVEAIYSKCFEILKETTKLPGKRIVMELITVPDAFARLGN